MELNLTGKTVVITGGSSGIGKDVAHEYLKEGCNVAICARGKGRLDDTYEEFRKEGYEIMTGVVDVSDFSGLSRFADEVAAKYGKIDIWYNNAGFYRNKSLIDYDIDEFRSDVDKLMVSDFSGCKIAAALMKKTGGGVIMNASSFNTTIPRAGGGLYAACKAGVDLMTQVLAAELARDNIRVISYAPGMITTDIRADIGKSNPKIYERLLRDIPIRREGTVQEVSKLLVFLSSEHGSYVNGVRINITGAKLCVQNPEYAWNLNN
jgi:3-oxoacyl-[acyl-carrier protein] reductase